MRLWHKDLIDILPQRQLVAQWRECCAIARSIAVNGSPKHILVNKIMDYPMDEFWAYTRRVYHEMRSRGYSCDFSCFAQWFPKVAVSDKEVDEIDIFANWHTKRYFWQCYANLEEKYDCGGVPEEDWHRIEDRMKEVILV